MGWFAWKKIRPSNQAQQDAWPHLAFATIEPHPALKWRERSLPDMPAERKTWDENGGPNP